jgi:2-dehydropantoate 2-reductase
VSTLIFGAGAIGQWLGALLFSSGSEVQLHGRPRVAAAIKEQGGIVLNGSTPIDLPFSSRIEELTDRRFDTVICTVKTFAVESALQELSESGLEFEELVSFQNGWGTEAAYLKIYPEKKLWALTTTRAIGIEQPGRLTPAKKGGLAVAPWDPNKTQGLPDALRRVKIPLVILERGIDLKWSKLLLNLIGNATGAITGLSPQHLANQPLLMRTELELTREAMAVGAALGVRRMDLPSFPVKVLSGAIEKLPLRVVSPLIAARLRRARGEKLPSLFYDLEEPSRPTEIDHLNGAVAQEGARLGVPTPKQRALVDLFHKCRREPDVWMKIRRDPILMMDYV